MTVPHDVDVKQLVESAQQQPWTTTQDGARAEGDGVVDYICVGVGCCTAYTVNVFEA